MSAERWLGDVGDLRSDPVVDVFVDRFSKMLDGEYLTDPAQYVATAGPAA